MKKIQEEARIKFPIGCKFIAANNNHCVKTLSSDSYTYSINGDRIWADSGNGSLYINGVWATLLDNDGNEIKDNSYEIY
jgi:hypothetical protein